MSESSQYRYECNKEIKDGLLKVLSLEGYIIKSDFNDDRSSEFHKIWKTGNESIPLWIAVSPHDSEDDSLLIDIHWFAKTQDKEPLWMIHLSETIENYMKSGGVRRIF